MATLRKTGMGLRGELLTSYTATRTLLWRQVVEPCHILSNCDMVGTSRSAAHPRWLSAEWHPVHASREGGFMLVTQ